MIWKDVAGYEGMYEVSDAGYVRSVERRCASSPKKGGSRVVPSKILVGDTKRGYPTVCLWKDSRYKCVKTALLVLEAFVGPRGLGMDVCHNDGIRTNSALDNLRYDTRAGNLADRKRHGTIGWKQTKLTEDDVRNIKQLSKEVSGLTLARDYNVCQATISHILCGRNWAHVQ